jgi:uncharacterized protein
VEAWERRFEEFLRGRAEEADAAHDQGHVRRVVENARRIAAAEGARLEVVLPAAWLHDCVSVPKGSPLRGRASSLADQTAGVFLRGAGYPEEAIPEVEHAIEAHSFTAGIEPRTLEARVVQDADRLDALGAIGIARCLMLGGESGKPLFNPEEPIPERRATDDSSWVLDHFFAKLLRLEDLMTTETGRRLARERTAFVRVFLDRLAREIV